MHREGNENNQNDFRFLDRAVGEMVIELFEMIKTGGKALEGKINIPALLMLNLRCQINTICVKNSVEGTR